MVPPVQKSFVSSSTSPESDVSPKRLRRKCKQTMKSPNTGEQSQLGMSRNAARERYRVKSLRDAFQNLQSCLPSVPPNTKLSKLDVLILATTYISHLSRILVEDDLLQNENGFSLNDIFQMDSPVYPAAELESRNPSWEKSYLHPVRKWPMRSRLYAGVEENDSTGTSGSTTSLQLRQWC